MPTEADTCREHVVPLLQAAGRDTEFCSLAEQSSITDGRENLIAYLQSQVHLKDFEPAAA